MGGSLKNNRLRKTSGSAADREMRGKENNHEGDGIRVDAGTSREDGHKGHLPLTTQVLVPSGPRSEAWIEFLESLLLGAIGTNFWPR